MLLTIISIYPRKQNKLNISLHLETSNLGDVSGEIIPVHLSGLSFTTPLMDFMSHTSSLHWWVNQMVIFHTPLYIYGGKISELPQLLFFWRLTLLNRPTHTQLEGPLETMSLSSLACFQSPQLLDSFVLSSLAYPRNSFLSGVHVDSNANQIFSPGLCNCKTFSEWTSRNSFLYSSV